MGGRQAASSRDGHQLTSAQHGFRRYSPVREEDTLGQHAHLLEGAEPGTGIGPDLPQQVAEAVQDRVHREGDQLQPQEQ